MRLVASTRLHRATGLIAGNRIRGDPFVVHLVEHPSSIGVVAGEVQQVDSGEDDQKSTEQRDRVDSIGGVESFEEDERGAKCCGGKRNIVQWVDTFSRLLALHFNSYSLIRGDLLTYMDVENWFSALLK